MSATPRRDGRTADAIRSIRISYDGLARVDGSARFAFGELGAKKSNDVLNRFFSFRQNR